MLNGAYEENKLTTTKGTILNLTLNSSLQFVVPIVLTQLKKMDEHAWDTCNVVNPTINHSLYHHKWVVTIIPK